MKYRNVGVKAGHKIFIREKTTAFDKKPLPSGSFQEFTDHKKMTTWEYAAFQKEQFKLIRQRKRIFFVLLSSSIIVAFVVLFLAGAFFEWFGDYGGLNF